MTTPTTTTMAVVGGSYNNQLNQQRKGSDGDGDGNGDGDGDGDVDVDGDGDGNNQDEAMLPHLVC